MDGKQNEILSLLNECKCLNKLIICFSIKRLTNIARQVFNYDLDADDKRREELKFLHSIKFLQDYPLEIEHYSFDDPTYWMYYFRESTTPFTKQEIENALPEILEKHGNSTLEMYRK